MPLKCRITRIFELDEITLKSSHLKRVGLTGELLLISVGYPMWIKYNDGHGTLMTSSIDSVDEDHKNLKVKTHNAIYVLEKL